MDLPSSEASLGWVADHGELDEGDPSSLENEKALERMVLTQARMETLLLGSVFVNMAGIATGTALTAASGIGAAVFFLKAFAANGKIKKFDKTQAKFVSTKFQEAYTEDEE